MSIAAVMKALNVEVMDYGLESAIRQALIGCEEVVLAVGKSVDGTEEIVRRLADEFPNRVKYRIYQIDLDRQWQEKAWSVGRSLTKCDWLFALDADEGIHEKDWPTLRWQIANVGAKWFSFPVAHFYGTPNYIARGPEFYIRHCRIGHRDSGFGIKNFRTDTNRRPVCDVVGRVEGKVRTLHDWDGEGMHSTDITLWHYGWVRSAQAMSTRRIVGDAWYTNDPRYRNSLPQDTGLFNYEMRKSLPDLEHYQGRHPKHFYSWFDLAPHYEEWLELAKQVGG